VVPSPLNSDAPSGLCRQTRPPDRHLEEEFLGVNPDLASRTFRPRRGDVFRARARGKRRRRGQAAATAEPVVVCGRRCRPRGAPRRGPELRHLFVLAWRMRLLCESLARLCIWLPCLSSEPTDFVLGRRVWFQPARKYTGMVEDCCCDYETVDAINEEVLHPILQDLVTLPFFRYFKVSRKWDYIFSVEFGA
jgi:hypothetical protein